MEQQLSVFKKNRIVKAFMVLIIFLFSKSIYTQNPTSEPSSNDNQNPYKTTITFNKFLDIKDLFTFIDQPAGIKAITEEGKVEIRMYHSYTYNNDQKRENPSFLLGFYSENVDNNAEYIQTDWQTKACYGNAFTSCDSQEADSQTVSSTQTSEMQKRVLEAYKKEHDESVGFNEVTNKLLKVVIEIDYDLPQDFYNDFTFELYIPGIGLLKHADFIIDTDNDGFPDGIDACVNTPGTVEGCPDEDEDFIKDQADNNLGIDQCIDIDMPGLTVETDPNSDRLGCAIVPTDVAGDNLLTVNEAIAGDEVMISKDRSCFFSVRSGKFRTYEAKYYESVMNSPLDAVKDIEFIHDIIDEFDFDDIDRDGVVDGYDFQDLDGDGVDDDNFVDSDNDGFYESPDHNDLPSGDDYEFELYHNNESSGLSFKQNGEIFETIYEHVFDDASSILLTNQASCNLFPILKESYINQIENQNLHRDTQEIQVNDPDFVEVEIDPNDDLEFRQILRYGDVEKVEINELSIDGKTAIKIEQIEDPVVDNILLPESAEPIINQLVSENGLYTFSPDSEFTFYDLATYRNKINRIIATGFVGTAVGVLGIIEGVAIFAGGVASENPIIILKGIGVAFSSAALTVVGL